MEEQPQRLSDEEFLSQAADRLSEAGHGFILIDRGLLRFGKFAAATLGIFAIIGIAVFGLNIREAAGDLERANGQLKSAREDLAATTETLRSGRSKAQELINEIEDLQTDAHDQLVELRAFYKESLDEQLAAIGNATKESERLLNDSLRSTLTSLTDFYAKRIIDNPDALSDLLRSNADFAEANALKEVHVRLLTWLAENEWDAENRETAAEVYDEAVAAAKRYDLLSLAAETLMQRGSRELVLTPDEQDVAAGWARRHFEQALALFEDTSDVAGLARANHMIAKTYERQNNREAALERLQRAHDHFRRAGGNLQEEFDTTVRLGELYLEEGKPQNAADHFGEAVRIALELGDYLFASDYLLELAKLETAKFSRRKYMCRAVTHFERTEGHKRPDSFAKELAVIDSAFDREAHCG